MPRSVGARRAALAGVLVAVLALVSAGCGSGDSGGDSARPAASGAPLKGTVTVFAAASLTDTFDELGRQFEAAHPGVKVVFNYAGSSTLARNINQGAPADVFASADERTMKTVLDARNTDGAPTDFARNTLQIAVAPGNPQRISSLADLRRPGLKVALCAEQVPCGSAAKKALDAAGVSVTPATYEQDVRSALTKLTLGEVDASLVYRTDVRASGGKAQGLDFPQAQAAVNTYPIVLLKHAPNRDAAQQFVAFVESAPGRAALAAAGFQQP